MWVKECRTGSEAERSDRVRVEEQSTTVDVVSVCLWHSTWTRSLRSASLPVLLCGRSDPFASLKTKGRRFNLLPKMQHLKGGLCPGCPACATLGITQNRQLHFPASKSHRLARAGNPDIDALAFDESASVSHQVLTAVSASFQSYTCAEWQQSRIRSD